MFTKKTPEEVFGVMQQYGATHVVLSKSRCFAKSKSGCTMSYIVSIDNPPSNPSNPLFCTLAQQSPLVSKVETKGGSICFSFLLQLSCLLFCFFLLQFLPFTPTQL